MTAVTSRTTMGYPNGCDNIVEPYESFINLNCADTDDKIKDHKDKVLSQWYKSKKECNATDDAIDDSGYNRCLGPVYDVDPFFKNILCADGITDKHMQTEEPELSCSFMPVSYTHLTLPTIYSV